MALTTTALPGHRIRRDLKLAGIAADDRSGVGPGISCGAGGRKARRCKPFRSAARRTCNGVGRVGQPSGASGEQAARQRGEHRGERQAGDPERLGHLVAVLVAADLVGPQIAHDLAAQQVLLGRPPGAGGAAGRDDDDVVGLDQPRAMSGASAEDRRRRIAAGRGHARTLTAICSRAPGSSGSPYGQLPACSPPYPAAQSAGSVSRWSAPRSMTRVDAGQRSSDAVPTRRAEARGRRRRRSSAPHRSAAKVRPASGMQLRMDVGDGSARRRARRQLPELHLRMPEQQAKQLAARRIHWLRQRRR